MKDEPNEKQVYLDVNNFSCGQFLGLSKGVGWNVLGGQVLVKLAKRDSQPTVRAAVPQDGSSVFGGVMDPRVLVRHGELSEWGSVDIELLHKNEEIHVVGTIHLNPKMGLWIAKENGLLLELWMNETEPRFDPTT